MSGPIPILSTAGSCLQCDTSVSSSSCTSFRYFFREIKLRIPRQWVKRLCGKKWEKHCLSCCVTFIDIPYWPTYLLPYCLFCLSAARLSLKNIKSTIKKEVFIWFVFSKNAMLFVKRKRYTPHKGVGDSFSVSDTLCGTQATEPGNNRTDL